MAEIHVQLKLSDGRIFTFGTNYCEYNQLIDKVSALLREGFKASLASNTSFWVEIPACLRDHILIVGPLTKNCDGSRNLVLYGIKVIENGKLRLGEIQQQFTQLDEDDLQVAPTPDFDPEAEATAAPLADKAFSVPTQSSDGSGDGGSVFDRLIPDNKAYKCGSVFTTYSSNGQAYSSGSSYSSDSRGEYYNYNHPHMSEGCQEGDMVVTPLAARPSPPSNLGHPLRDPSIIESVTHLQTPRWNGDPRKIVKPEGTLFGIEDLLVPSDTPSDKQGGFFSPFGKETPTSEHPLLVVEKVPIAVSTEASSARVGDATPLPASDQEERGTREEGGEQEEYKQPAEESGSRSGPSPASGRELVNLAPKAQHQLCSGSWLAGTSGMVTGFDKPVTLCESRSEPGSLAANDSLKAENVTETHSEPVSQAVGVVEVKRPEQATNASDENHKVTEARRKLEFISAQDLPLTPIVQKVDSPVEIAVSGGFTVPLCSNNVEVSSSKDDEKESCDPGYDEQVSTPSSVFESAANEISTPESVVADPHTPVPSQLNTGYMVPAVQRQMSASGEVVMTGERQLLEPQKMSLELEQKPTERQDSRLLTSSVSGVSESRGTSQVGGVSEEEVDVHALEHACNGKEANCIFRGDKRLCRKLQRDRVRVQGMHQAVAEYRLGGTVSEALKQLIRVHCWRPCLDPSCDVPHLAAGCQPPGYVPSPHPTPTSSLTTYTTTAPSSNHQAVGIIGVSYDTQAINDSRYGSAGPQGIPPLDDFLRREISNGPNFPTANQCTEGESSNRKNPNQHLLLRPRPGEGTVEQPDTALQGPYVFPHQHRKYVPSPDTATDRHLGHSALPTSLGFRPLSPLINDAQKFNGLYPSPYALGRPSDTFTAQQVGSRMGFPIDTTNVGGVASSQFGYGHAGRQPQGYYPYGPQQRNYCYGRPGTEAKPFMQRTLQPTKDIPDASQGFPQYSEYASRSCPPGTVLYSSEDVRSFLFPGSTIPLPDFNRIPARDFLGKGGNGDIFRYWLNGQEFAVKRTIYRPHELNYWSKFNHLNIVTLKAVVLGPVIRSHGYCFQFMAKMDDNLSTVLKRLGTHGLQTLLNSVDSDEWVDVIMPNVRHILRGILEGLNYMHTDHQQHCDIKASNVLIHKVCACPNVFQCKCPVGQKCEVKIADFDSVRVVSHGNHDYTNYPDVPCVPKTPDECRKVMGTPGYRSPEQFVSVAPMVNQGHILVSLVGPWCDIWSFGLIVLQFFLGSSATQEKKDAWTLLSRPHMKELSSTEVQAEAVYAEMKLLSLFRTDYLDVAAKFASQCLEPNFRKRPTAEQLLGDPFLRPPTGGASVAD